MINANWTDSSFWLPLAFLGFMGVAMLLYVVLGRLYVHTWPG